MIKGQKEVHIPSTLGRKIDGELERLRSSRNMIAEDVLPRFNESGYENLRTHPKWVRGCSFLRDHIDRFERTRGKSFIYNPSLRSENMMDRWMLSRCHSTIIRLEEKSYEAAEAWLGTLDELSVWYMRFNRSRLRGQTELEDNATALNTVLITLYHLGVALSLFTPFNKTDLTDLLYFLPLVKLETPTVPLRDLELERQMEHLKSVIEVLMIVRERCLIPVKAQLKDLVVFHPDRQFLVNVKLMEVYILQYMNIARMNVTSERGDLDVQAKRQLCPEQTLEALARFKKALPNISSSQFDRYTRMGEINLDGISLEDRRHYLLVSQQDKASDEGWYSWADGDMVVLVDYRGIFLPGHILCHD